MNRKHTFSLLLQGTTAHLSHFIAILMGYSGKHHDTFIFKESSLCVAMDAGVFVPGKPTIRLGGAMIPTPPLILADPAYPLLEWLMKTYGGLEDRREMLFDCCLSSARNVVLKLGGGA